MDSVELFEPDVNPIPAGMPRVLIVENNETSRRMYRDLLSHWGYLPVTAEGIGQALIKNAKSKAREFRCQMALVDMRLLDDIDDEDKSGLDLISQLRPAVCIMMSGYGGLADSRKANEKGASGFMGKSEGPRAFKEKLEQESLKLCAYKKELNIEPQALLARLKKNLLIGSAARFDDQIADCLLRLFPDARRLRLEKIDTDNISSDLSTVPRPRSVILKVYEDDRQPVIVKLARESKIARELDNYRRYIDGQLKGNYVPVLRGQALMWDIGSIKLSYVGTINQTFSSFFQAQPVNKIKHSLNGFFTKTWEPHYQQAATAQNISLFELYCQVWEKDWVTRIKNFSNFHPEEVIQQPIWEDAQTPNPIDWMKINIFNGRDASVVEYTKTAITHGDLHGDNMLVDANNNIWVVDFERTRDGHILQDFIELESDIINRLPCTPENLPAFLSTCIAVCEHKEIKGMELTEAIEAQSETRKALLTISYLRSLARDCTGIHDARQYLLGLLFNTLFRATISTTNQRKHCQQRALMLASILCHRLDHWEETWPPPHWLKFIYNPRGNYGE